jgi:putative ABC transport system permease protein
LKEKRIIPPALATRLLNSFLRDDLVEEVEGDLEENFYTTIKTKSVWRAKVNYWFQVLNYLRPFAFRKSRPIHINQYAMFQNYFKTGWRNILKYKMFSFINVFGLSVAMSVCMLIILMLADQKRYDQFHEKKDHVYRILSDYEYSGQPYATSPFPLAAALKNEYTIIKSSTNLLPKVGGDVVYQQKLAEMRGYFTDPSFFEIFSFDLLSGNKKTALELPNSIIISSTIAGQLFGREDAIGKTVEFFNRNLSFPIDNDGISSAARSWGNFTVTGVIDDTKYASHLKFDALVSSSTLAGLYAENKIENTADDWTNYWRTYTFILLDETKTENDLTLALNDLVKRKYANIKAEEVKGFKLLPQKLGDVQLNMKGNDTNNRLPMIGYYFLSFLALAIMISACLNYTNLSVARALTRAKEIGIRKVTGASRKSLIFQFVSEAIITAMLALVMSVGILFFLKPAFKGLWINKHLNFELPFSFSVYFAFAAFALLIGILAGLFPALHLSKFQPVKVLKSLSTASGKLGLRKVLSVSQFVISLFFIVTSILIFQQFKHFLQFDYGFNSKNIVNVELQGIDYQKLAHEFSTISGVASVSASDIIPATGTNNGNEARIAGTESEYKRIGILVTDENFINNLNLKLIAGRPLAPSSEASDHFIVVNEEFTRDMGFKQPVEIVGQTLQTKWGNESLVVIGVVKDFRHQLLVNGKKSGALMLRHQPGAFNYLNVKISSTDLVGTVAMMEKKWKAIDPVHPLKYRFYDDQLVNTHQAIFDLVAILGFIAFLAIVIACLGMLGMATYTAERKKKEVGIRKVLGAADFGIALLLSKEFLKVLAIAVLVGAPLSYFVNNLWLQYFPARVEFGFATVFTGTLVLLTLGLITIGSQTISASKTNPVDSLKSE